ncbi:MULTISPECIES: hypothetical protein [Pseudoalteromonas]|nr:hypothetical protein [Pseudoalteromonas sp. A757]RXE84624.1 hypothetical protein DRB05_22165 [Pseudoalteromonas sp. A757]
MFRLILLSITLLYLSGCATYELKTANLNSNAPLPQQHGMVSVEVINNVDRLAPLHKGWSELIVLRLDNRDALKQAAIEEAKAKAVQKNKAFDESKVEWDPDVYTLTPHSRGLIESQVFVGSLPEGEYVVASLYSFFSNGEIMSWISMPVNYLAGKFEIKQNTTTNLGSIAFQPLKSIKEKSFWDSTSSNKAFVTRLDQAINMSDFIKHHYPVASQQLHANKELQWQNDEFDSLRSSLAQLVRENAFPSSHFALNKFGKAIITSRFGQARILNHKGTWDAVNLPTNIQLLSAIELNQGIALAGEKGELYYSDSNLKNWRQIKPVETDQAIVWMANNGNQSFALTASAKQYTVYQFFDIKDKWNQIGQYKRKNSNDWLVQNGGIFPFFNSNNQLNILNDNKLHVYQQATNTWSMEKALELKELIQLPGSELLAIEVSQWDGVGDTVYKLTPESEWVVVKKNANNLFGNDNVELSLPVVRKDHSLINIAYYKEHKNAKSELRVMYASSDNPKQWIAKGKASKSCTQTLPKISYDKTLYVMCERGQIKATDDLGYTWYSVLDVNIDKMQNEFETLLNALEKVEQNKEN